MLSGRSFSSTSHAPRIGRTNANQRSCHHGARSPNGQSDTHSWLARRRRGRTLANRHGARPRPINTLAIRVRHHARAAVSRRIGKVRIGCGRRGSRSGIGAGANGATEAEMRPLSRHGDSRRRPRKRPCRPRRQPRPSDSLRVGVRRQIHQYGDCNERPHALPSR